MSTGTGSRRVESGSAGWMRWTLRLAGLYNVAWGAAVVVAPFWLFDFANMPRPNYPGIWQCVGMIVGVYGVGYWCAAADPLRHWPIVLVGLLGKIFGPIGFIGAVISGEFSPWFGVTIVTNDLVWWIPFTVILWRAARHNTSGGVEDAPPLPLTTALAAARDQHGQGLLALSAEQLVLVVFLRHAGCTFCREALADLRAQRKMIEARGVRLVLVHMMASVERAEAFFAEHGLEDVKRVADPQQALYRSFELQRGSFGQLFGMRVWWRGLSAGLRGHGIGRLEGDGFQMPGAFLVRNGKIVRAFRHATAADRPDYAGLACEVGAGEKRTAAVAAR